MSKYGTEVAQRKAEDEADVRYIIRNFKTDGYTKERLEMALKNEKEHLRAETEKKYSCRMNRNVIAAIEQILQSPEMTIPYES